jgi:hypothetical protein
MTLESEAAACLHLTIWCKAYGHRAEPDPCEQARWFGPELPVPVWRKRLVCLAVWERKDDMVMTGERR